MKIAAIMGSPHRGNSYEVTERIQKKLMGYGNVEFEYIHLKDMDIKPCRGCFVCFLEGEDHCPLKDDRRLVEEAIEATDGVIFVSPVYSMHISCLMKLFIDRSAYIFHRPRYFGKCAISLCTTGAVGTKAALKYLKMVASLWGFNYIGGLGYVMPPKEMNIAPMQGRDRMDSVIKRFYMAIKENHPVRLSLLDHIGFRAMREVYSRMEGHSPADYEYWKAKGWFDSKAKYYTDHAKTNPFMGLVARIVARLVRSRLNKIMNKER
jgi:multimeric flavodoxin WrbA